MSSLDFYTTYSHLPVDQVSPGKIKEAHLVKDLMVEKTFTITKKSPVVALDIDGVMADFNAAMKPYSLVAESDIDCPESYNFVDSGWFDNFDDFEQAHVKVMDKAGDIPLADPTAPAAVNKLVDHGFKVLAVTARREPWRKETLRFFSRHNINITDDRLFFMDKKNKSEMGFDYIIDDAPKNIIDALAHSQSFPVIYNQPYNNHLPGVRVSTLEDFADVVIDHHGSVAV